MAEDILLKTLEEDARNQAATLLGEAEKRAREIIEEAVSEAESFREARLRELSETLEKECAAVRNAARVRSSEALLKARRAVIDMAIDGVLESYRNMPEEQYALLLNRLCSILMKDLSVDGQTRLAIRVNPADTGKLAGCDAEVVADTEVSLGVAFVSADGKVRKYLTIPSIIAKTRKRLETEIDKAVFG